MNTTKEKNFPHNLRKYLREHNEVTGIHGLRYLTEKRSRVEKCVWAVILLFSLGWCVYMIHLIIQKYRTSPVVVSFATKETPIYEIPFPAVTICPETKFSAAMFNYTNTYFKLNNNKTLTEAEYVHYKYEQQIIVNRIKLFQYMNILCDEEFGKEYVSEAMKTVDYETLINLTMTLRPRGAFYCFFMKTNYDEYFQSSSVLTPTITDQGLCYSFNILDRSVIFRDNVVQYGNFFQAENQSCSFDGDFGYEEDAGVETYPRRALKSGADNALEIYLVSNLDDQDYLCSKFHQGYRVLIHDPMDIPRLSKHYFRVPLGKSAIAAIEPSRVTTSEAVTAFNPEKRHCYLRNERPLKYFKLYTQSNCMFECLANYTLIKCGCLPYFMPRTNETATCGPGSDTCLEIADRELVVKELEDKISKKVARTCDCKPLCTDLKFNVETSHSDFVWKEFLEVRSDINITVEDDEDEVDDLAYSVLSIYFKSEQFMTLERNELYGFSDFVSNFGGLASLFTGFSLITLAEIIYFLTLRIFCNGRLYGMWSGPRN